MFIGIMGSGPQFLKHEQDHQREASGNTQSNRFGRTPFVALSTPHSNEQQQDDTENKQTGTELVDVVLTSVRNRQVQNRTKHR